MIHYSFIGYILATSVILLICAIGYRVLMEGKVAPSINRRILLVIYAAMIIVPLIVAIIPEPSSASTIEFGDLEFGGFVGTVNHEISQNNNPTLFSLLNWVLNIYYIGLFLTFVITAIAVCRLLILIRRSYPFSINGVEVYLHNSKNLSSFSWCNKIFLYSDSIDSSSTDIELLLRHEVAHLNLGHWMDLAFAQIVIIFQWFNPAAWFMRRELQRIHEYEADESVISSGIEEEEYQMLLIRNISRNRYSGLTDGLNNCSLKKRIIMMKKTKFKKDWMFRGVAVCGFAILGGMIIHIPMVASVLEDSHKPATPEERMTMVRINPENLPSENSLAYYVDGKETSAQEVASMQPSLIKEIEIDKKSAETKVNVTTKSPVEYTASVSYDNSANYEKGVLEKYPDAYLSTEKIAEYKGGQMELMKDLAAVIQYPEEAKKEGIEGRVVVRFQINPDGSVSNCEVVRSPNPILNEAALKAVEDTSGNWIAGEVGGEPVASIFNIPVTFKLSGDSKVSPTTK